MFINDSDTGESIREISEEDKSAWQTAFGLGISEGMNQAGDSVYEDVMQGIKNAARYIKQQINNTDTIDAPKFIESAVKKSLSAKLPGETSWVKAQEDAKEALMPKINRTYKSAPLITYIKARELDDYTKGEYTTTKYVNQIFDPKTAEIQKILNKFGIKDKFGEPLKEDGLFGPKTLQAANKFLTEKSFEGQTSPSNNIIGGDNKHENLFVKPRTLDGAEKLKTSENAFSEEASIKNDSIGKKITQKNLIIKQY